MLGRLRKEASTAAQGRQAAEQALAEARATLDEQHGRLEKLEKELFASQQAIDELRERARSRPAAAPSPTPSPTPTPPTVVAPAPAPSAAPAPRVVPAAAAPPAAAAEKQADPEEAEEAAPAPAPDVGKDNKKPAGQPNARRSAMAELTALAAISNQPARRQ